MYENLYLFKLAAQEVDDSLGSYVAPTAVGAGIGAGLQHLQNNRLQYTDAMTGGFLKNFYKSLAEENTIKSNAGRRIVNGVGKAGTFMLKNPKAMLGIGAGLGAVGGVVGKRIADAERRQKAGTGNSFSGRHPYITSVLAGYPAMGGYATSKWM